MSLFKRTQTETPEQAFARDAALKQAAIARKQAHEADQEAECWQMDVDIYGREGRDYSDPKRVAKAVDQRDRHLRRRDAYLATADRQQQIADSLTPRKR